MGHHDDIRRRRREAAEALFKPKPPKPPEPEKKPVLMGQLPNGTIRPYIFRWNREGRHGQACRVLARGSLNSCLVEFADGFTMVTSRNALKRHKTENSNEP